MKQLSEAGEALRAALFSRTPTTTIKNAMAHVDRFDLVGQCDGAAVDITVEIYPVYAPTPDLTPYERSQVRMVLSGVYAGSAVDFAIETDRAALRGFAGFLSGLTATDADRRLTAQVIRQ